MSKIEWYGSLYHHTEHGLHIPKDNIEGCIRDGAQKSREGKNVQAVVFVADDIVPIAYSGPKNIDKMFGDERFISRKPVGLKGSRIMRTRAMIPTGWSITFTLEFDESIINTQDLVKAMQDAGALLGLCDGRPKFGRFTVEVLEESPE